MLSTAEEGGERCGKIVIVLSETLCELTLSSVNLEVILCVKQHLKTVKTENPDFDE